MSDTIDFENMSDEEFEQYANENPIADEDIVDGDIIEIPNDPEQEDDKVAIDEPEEVIEEPEEIEEPENLEDTDATVATDDEPEDTKEDTQETLDTPDKTGDEDTQVPVTEENEFDYKTGFSEIMAPIKANGQEVQIKSPEDARRLIQMGLNYDEKMVAIKPVRLAGKALERAGVIKDGVVDEDALNRMIDFNSGNTEIIMERLKELNIDPLDLDLEATNYEAQNHMVSEQSIVLDDVQKELDTRGTTGQVITAIQSMDQNSRDFFNEDPRQLLGLEQDIASGVFDEINGNVQYERRMGRLAGKSDMEAYIEFAQARGKLLAAQQQEEAAEAPAPTPKKKVNTEKRVKAGGSTPSATSLSEVVNPFDLSDEDFEKQFGSQQALR